MKSAVDSAPPHRLCIVGTFPPPVHGMAAINAAIRDVLGTRGSPPLVLDTSARSLDRTFRARLTRLPRVGRAALTYLREAFSGGGTTLYAAVSDGWGQLYDVTFVALARAHRARLFIHHHSFAYVDCFRWKTWLLVRAAGSRATHVVLCDTMDERLRQQYRGISKTHVLSNAAFINSRGGRRRSNLTRIGFLGNISRAKGIFDVLDVAKRVAGMGIETRIAGPFDDIQIAAEVQRIVSDLPTVQIVGPKYGPEKDEFLDQIDVLLFPSLLTEASPLVVLEAMASGVPVIARERGCIHEMLSDRGGRIVSGKGEFATTAAEQIDVWKREPLAFASASTVALHQFQTLASSSKRFLEELVSELVTTAAGSED